MPKRAIPPTGTGWPKCGLGSLEIDPAQTIPQARRSEQREVTSSLAILSLGPHVVTATVEYAGPDLNPQNDTATLNILAASEQVYLPLMFHTGP
jgi:hypothetical protein